MLAAVGYVADHPGCTKVAVADEIGPHGARGFGYRCLDRAIRAGLIHAELGGRQYSLTLTEKGKELLWKES
jgi:hypothetical protein